MLADEMVEYLPYTGPRDYRNVVANIPTAVRIMRRYHVDTVISTGSAIALSFLPAAASTGRKAHYIESAARSDGPSATGKILQKFRRIELSSQYRSWAAPPWNHTVSVFDDFESEVKDPAPGQVSTLLVTVGTIEGYGFRRLLEHLLRIVPPGVDVTWQTGATDYSGLGIPGRPSMPQHVLQECMRDTDVVIAHAGIGSALGALNAGRRPILVPRRAAHAEHVDDHQAQIANELHNRKLATYREVETLTWNDVLEASKWDVRRKE